MSSSFTDQGMPTHQELVIPVLRALKELGGSAKASEIADRVQAVFPNGDELAEIMYPKKPTLSVFLDRVAWARSTSKKIAAAEQPSRGLWLITDFGESLLELSEEVAFSKVKTLNSIANRERRSQRDQTEETTAVSTDSDEKTKTIADTVSSRSPVPDSINSDDDVAEISAIALEDGGPQDWKDELLQRLHQLTPEGFEKFVIYLLKRYGLELSHTGKSNDEGIDAIGTAPLSQVLSSRVAVQVKRYDPNGKPIGRETVALFQRDAQTKGAERAILVTLSRFTEPARRAAIVATPTVDLINGDRLADLILEDGEAGVSLQPTVNGSWFDKFD